MIRKYFVYTPAVIFFCSCAGLKKVTVSEFGINKLRNISGSKALVEFKAKVDNPSAHKLRLKKSEFEIFKNGYSFGEAVLKDRIEVLPHSDDYCLFLIEIKITDAVSLMTGNVRDLLSGKNPDEMTLTGYVKAGTWFLSKKIRFEDYLLD